MFGSHEVPAELRRRIAFASAAASLALLLLVLRMWSLQILQGEELAALSENNRIRLRRIAATRGRVVDRYHRVLVESEASYDAMLVPEDARDLEITVETLAQFLDQSAAEVPGDRRQAWPAVARGRRNRNPSGRSAGGECSRHTAPLVP